MLILKVSIFDKSVFNPYGRVILAQARARQSEEVNRRFLEEATKAIRDKPHAEKYSWEDELDEKTVGASTVQGDIAGTFKIEYNEDSIEPNQVNNGLLGKNQNNLLKLIGKYRTQQDTRH